jgi:NMD protein affecting ribosome stability and mRNA decay
LEATNKYIELKEFLEKRGAEEVEQEEKIGFESLKIRNYCGLDRAYENLSFEEREEIDRKIGSRADGKKVSEKISKKIGINLDDIYKAIDLKKNRSNFGKGDTIPTI